MADAVCWQSAWLDPARMSAAGVLEKFPEPSGTPCGWGVSVWPLLKLADYKVPRRIMLLPALPRNATGKILKTELRKLTVA